LTSGICWTNFASMATHTATISWNRTSPDFRKGEYSRAHTWTFDGGLSIPDSPSPAVVPAPCANPAHGHPEEAFVAAIANCHMLTLLWLACRQGLQVDRCRDEAVGKTRRDAEGFTWVRTVTLHPQVVYGGACAPASTEEEHLHDQAHQQCFIANSVKREIRVLKAGRRTSRSEADGSRSSSIWIPKGDH
jgi:organic hydroperoxide reductase OsmC/OhrA